MMSQIIFALALVQLAVVVSAYSYGGQQNFNNYPNYNYGNSPSYSPYVPQHSNPQSYSPAPCDDTITITLPPHTKLEVFETNGVQKYQNYPSELGYQPQNNYNGYDAYNGYNNDMYEGNNGYNQNTGFTGYPDQSGYSDQYQPQNHYEQQPAYGSPQQQITEFQQQFGQPQQQYVNYPINYQPMPEQLQQYEFGPDQFQQQQDLPQQDYYQPEDFAPGFNQQNDFVEQQPQPQQINPEPFPMAPPQPQPEPVLYQENDPIETRQLIEKSSHDIDGIFQAAQAEMAQIDSQSNGEAKSSKYLNSRYSIEGQGLVYGNHMEDIMETRDMEVNGVSSLLRLFRPREQKPVSNPINTGLGGLLRPFEALKMTTTKKEEDLQPALKAINNETFTTRQSTPILPSLLSLPKQSITTLYEKVKDILDGDSGEEYVQKAAEIKDNRNIFNLFGINKKPNVVQKSNNMPKENRNEEEKKRSEEFDAKIGEENATPNMENESLLVLESTDDNRLSDASKTSLINEAEREIVNEDYKNVVDEDNAFTIENISAPADEIANEETLMGTSKSLLHEVENKIESKGAKWAADEDAVPNPEKYEATKGEDLTESSMISLTTNSDEKTFDQGDLISYEDSTDDLSTKEKSSKLIKNQHLLRGEEFDGGNQSSTNQEEFENIEMPMGESLGSQWITKNKAENSLMGEDDENISPSKENLELFQQNTFPTSGENETPVARDDNNNMNDNLGNVETSQSDHESAAKYVNVEDIIEGSNIVDVVEEANVHKSNGSNSQDPGQEIDNLHVMSNNNNFYDLPDESSNSDVTELQGNTDQTKINEDEIGNSEEVTEVSLTDSINKNGELRNYEKDLIGYPQTNFKTEGRDEQNKNGEIKEKKPYYKEEMITGNESDIGFKQKNYKNENLAIQKTNAVNDNNQEETKIDNLKAEAATPINEPTAWPSESVMENMNDAQYIQKDSLKFKGGEEDNYATMARDKGQGQSPADSGHTGLQYSINTTLESSDDDNSKPFKHDQSETDLKKLGDKIFEGTYTDNVSSAEDRISDQWESIISLSKEAEIPHIVQDFIDENSDHLPTESAKGLEKRYGPAMEDALTNKDVNNSLDEHILNPRVEENSYSPTGIPVSREVHNVEDVGLNKYERKDTLSDSKENLNELLPKLIDESQQTGGMIETEGRIEPTNFAVPILTSATSEFTLNQEQSWNEPMLNNFHTDQEVEYLLHPKINEIGGFDWMTENEKVDGLSEFEGIGSIPSEIENSGYNPGDLIFYIPPENDYRDDPSIYDQVLLPGSISDNSGYGGQDFEFLSVADPDSFSDCLVEADRQVKEQSNRNAVFGNQCIANAEAMGQAGRRQAQNDLMVDYDTAKNQNMADVERLDMCASSQFELCAEERQQLQNTVNSASAAANNDVAAARAAQMEQSQAMANCRGQIEANQDALRIQSQQAVESCKSQQTFLY